METIDDGSRTGSAHNARSSLLPVPVPAILVYGPNGRSGDPLGYVSKGYVGGQYYFTTDCNQAMKDAKLVSGDLTNPAEPNGYLNVGLVPDTDPPNIGTRSSRIGFLTGTVATPKGPPVKSEYTSRMEGIDWPMESNI
ncbi:hypothetical protein FRC01_008445, partial [Tulasnella sp. 417]